MESSDSLVLSSPNASVNASETSFELTTIPVSDELSELRERNARLSLLSEISNVVHATLDPEQALARILREAVRVMRASSGSAVLVNPTNGLLEIHATHGLPAQAVEVKLRV